MLLLCLLSVPTAVVWATAYAGRPGVRGRRRHAVAPSGGRARPGPGAPLAGRAARHRPRARRLDGRPGGPAAGRHRGRLARGAPARSRTGPAGTYGGRGVRRGRPGRRRARRARRMVARGRSVPAGWWTSGRTPLRVARPPASRSVRSPRSSRTRAAGTTTHSSRPRTGSDGWLHRTGARADSTKRARHRPVACAACPTPPSHASSAPLSPARLVVLVSGAGTNLQALLDACADPAYGARVVAVGADRAGIEGAGAGRAGPGSPTFVVQVDDYPDRGAWDAALTEAVADARARPGGLGRAS